MNYGICTLSMMPVRAEARHGSEMVNMLLFGETFQVLESVENWHRIQCTLDNYEGWITSRKLHIIDAEYRLRYVNETPVYLNEVSVSVPGDRNDLKLTFGSRLPIYKENSIRIGDSSWELKASVKVCERARTGDQIVETAHHYLQTPYLWGGRSIFGIDCSGLTQMVFLLNGIKLPRDAYQQAEQGINIASLQDAIAGDLAFFAEKEKISHVGILIGDGRIIHASEQVRIDKINEQGIYNRDIEAYTLKVKSIRRFV